MQGGKRNSLLGSRRYCCGWISVDFELCMPVGTKNPWIYLLRGSDFGTMWQYMFVTERTFSSLRRSVERGANVWTFRKAGLAARWGLPVLNNASMVTVSFGASSLKGGHTFGSSFSHLRRVSF
jgi:hypothetical protein